MALALGASFVVAACGGTSESEPHRSVSAGDAGASGDAATGGGGTGQAGSGMGGKASMAGAGRPASSGGSGGTAGVPSGVGGDGNAGPAAGAPSAGGGSGGATGGSAGRGASGKGGGAGKAAGGSGGSAPVSYLPPAMGQTWQFPSGDLLNSTTPVVLAVDDDVVIAGASADPATVGVDAFDVGITSEAFVMRLSGGKPVWSKPLKAAGLPWAIARSGDDVIIVAPNLPDLAQVSTSYVSKDVYIAKIGLDGTVRYEKTVTFDHEDTFTYGLAVDPSGGIFLAGGYQDPDPDTGSLGEHVILAKCDTDGKKLWDKPFPHNGTQAYANAVSVLTSGDVVVAGAFDNDVSFGGSTEALSSSALLMGLPSGFVARFTKDGDAVWSHEFGGDDFATGTALAALPNDEFLLAGAAALDLNLGGKTAKGAPYTMTDTQPFPPTAGFVSRLDGDGSASWLTLELGSQFAQVVATDGAGTVFLGGSVDSGMIGGGAIYLRTYDLATGGAVDVLAAADGEGISSTSLSVAPSGSLWVSGMYAARADFGNENILQTTDVGVFLLKVDPK